MPVIKYRVHLSDIERKKLSEIIARGSAPARMIIHAQVLLAADVSQSPKISEVKIAALYNINPQTVHTIRRNYATKGLDFALARKRRTITPVSRKINDAIEAQIVAISSSEPPKGYGKWTLRLLAKTLVEMKIIDSISHETVGQILKKTSRKTPVTRIQIPADIAI